MCAEQCIWYAYCMDRWDQGSNSTCACCSDNHDSVPHQIRFVELDDLASPSGVLDEVLCRHDLLDCGSHLGELVIRNWSWRAWRVWGAQCHVDRTPHFMEGMEGMEGSMPCGSHSTLHGGHGGEGGFFTLRH